MYIKELRIREFRHLRDVHLGPFEAPGQHCQLHVLAGPNGGGKSSVLELVGYALSTTWNMSWSIQRQGLEASSFEIAVGLSQDEVALIRTFVQQSATDMDLLEALEREPVYYRAYNYSGGSFESERALNQRLHNLAVNVLRGQHERPFGFFIRADRNYSQSSWDPHALYRFEAMKTRSHKYGLAFTTSDAQFRDMFEFLIVQRYDQQRRLGAWFEAQERDPQTAGARPTDPFVQYAQLLETLFPGYRFTDVMDAPPNELYVQLPTGDVIKFSDLSSGEKEVFYILAFILRQDVSSAVVVVDEPELHLHPELARRLVSLLQTVRPHNQVWLATHNGEVIDEAGRDRVIYVSRHPETQQSVIITGGDDEATQQLFRELFGYSGYLGITGAVAFLEGTDGSADRRAFTQMFPGQSIRFVPTGSYGSLSRINSAVLALLSNGFGYMDFYLIRDRDYLTDDVVEAHVARAAGRLHVLKRNQIENYLIELEAIRLLLEQSYAHRISVEELRDCCIGIAREQSTRVLRDMISSRLNMRLMPQDFSLGRFMEDQPFIDSRGSTDESRVLALTQQFVAKATQVESDVRRQLSQAEVATVTASARTEVEQATADASMGWQTLFPGKMLIAALARRLSLGPAHAFQNQLLREFALRPELIPEELSLLVDRISKGEALS